MIEKFNKDSEFPIERLKETRPYYIRERLDNGYSINYDEEEYITEKVNYNAYFKTAIPVLGWKISFEDVLQRFIYKDDFRTWIEAYATSERSLRKVILERTGIELYEVINLTKYYEK